MLELAEMMIYNTDRHGLCLHRPGRKVKKGNVYGLGAEA